MNKSDYTYAELEQMAETDAFASNKMNRSKVVGNTPKIRATWGSFMVVGEIVESKKESFRPVSLDDDPRQDLVWGVVGAIQGGIKFTLDSNMVRVHEAFDDLDVGGSCFEHWFFCDDSTMEIFDGLVIARLCERYSGMKLTNMIDLYMNPTSSYPLAHAKDKISPLSIFH